MKIKVLLCGAALIGAVGCASPQSPYAGSAGQIYTYDMVPSPLPDLTPAELQRINRAAPPPSYAGIGEGSGRLESIDLDR